MKAVLMMGSDMRRMGTPLFHRGLQLDSVTGSICSESKCCMDLSNDRRPFANCRRESLRRSRADITDREYTGDTSLQRQGTTSL